VEQNVRVQNLITYGSQKPSWLRTQLRPAYYSCQVIHFAIGPPFCCDVESTDCGFSFRCAVTIWKRLIPVEAVQSGIGLIRERPPNAQKAGMGCEPDNLRRGNTKLFRSKQK
jgi:hypothetical protein